MSAAAAAAAAAVASSSSEQQQQQYPVKSSSSTLRPPSSETTTVPPSRTFQQRNPRPLSEVIRPDSYISPEIQYIYYIAEALDKWFEDLQEYEHNLESMASASLDTRFKDELQHVDQWFSYLNEAERTATVYSLLQHSSQVQIRFFITVLQQMGKKDPVGSLLSPAHPEKSDMQAQLAGAMAKAELEASQKLLSVLPYRTGHSSAAIAAAAARNVDRHSFALGEADEHRLLSSLGPDFLTSSSSSTSRPNSTTSSSFGAMMEESFNRPTSSGARLKPSRAAAMYNNVGTTARPRSVIEGDLSSIFSNSGNNSNTSWSGFNSGRTQQPGGGGMAGIDPHRASTGRPKSADISNWSFGLSGDHVTAATGNVNSSSSPWGSLSPTMSTFSEHAKTIERPSSASDIDQLAMLANNWKVTGGGGRNVILNDDTKRFPRRRNHPVVTSAAGKATSIPGTVPESDERNQVADIVLSMYDNNTTTSNNNNNNGPIPQQSTSANSFGGASTPTTPTTSKRLSSRPTSPVPASSNSATLSPYNNAPRSPRQQQHNPRSHLQQQQQQQQTPGFGRFLNPNDLVEGDYDYLSDHSESSNVSGRNNYHPRYNNNNRKKFGQRGGGGNSNMNNNGNNQQKEKKYSDVVDLQLLEDVPGWLRSLRLHKYNNIFETMKWQDMVKLSNDDLEAKGVAALGARRKMLKVFDQVKQHCEKNVKWFLTIIYYP
ncbi:hypothetical protein INT45_004166 [Circinella minor]|uniref:RNA-binding protein VTS1 n=1 Tax=Circinella minor TaxID=1195481 RepID=A0A8H7VC05_9FUNG|nr:hypothetical protein INT45_004166 [Circinella minor]